MPDTILPLIDTGPFDQITAFSFPALSYHLRIVRDDGFQFAPDSEEGVSIRLFDTQWEFLCEANSWADPVLTYTEATPGLIARFTYQAPYYILTFSMPVVREFLQRHRNDFQVYLVTEGGRSLETLYPRRYAEEGDPVAISPGHYDLSIPFWELTTTPIHPDLNTTIQETLLRTSIPYTAHYEIANGNALARFRFPILAVLWSPNASLTGWTYDLHFTAQCPGLETFVPKQSIDGLTPPDDPPLSHNEEVRKLYTNLILTLGLGACSNLWNGLRLQVSTDFGFETTIPFIPANSGGKEVVFPIPGIHPPNLFGDTYSRTHRLIWETNHFLYHTGFWPNIHQDQAATLVQSPVTQYETLQLQPQAE
ncbi:MAG: hypothetical protein HQM00_01375 [Magnetococcales bacterium]|nr:hypothetical protein [Magnetococcales bacterium]